MKLRIQANSIRFRITPTELQALATRGQIESAVQLGNAAENRLTYVLESSDACSRVEAQYAAAKIRVMLPAKEVREWASTERVAIEGVQCVAGGELKILVEKDFKCLQPRSNENEADRFPNPADKSRASPITQE